eukprot:8264481-Lingulodinium_polyedra.AAC.1
MRWTAAWHNGCTQRRGRCGRLPGLAPTLGRGWRERPRSRFCACASPHGRGRQTGSGGARTGMLGRTLH